MLDRLAAADAVRNARLLIDAAGGMSIVTDWPMASWGVYPNRRSAPPIPAGDDAVHIFTDDRVIGELPLDAAGGRMRGRIGSDL